MFSVTPDPFVYLRHLDDLSTTETEFLIVIQNSVHALDPECVHWTIKHEPFLVWCVVGNSLSNEAGYDTVSPGVMVETVRLLVSMLQYVYMGSVVLCT